MIRYVALLEGVNQIGVQPVRMEELCAHFAMPGIENIASYSLSGNVLFDAEETNETLLRSRLEAQLEQKLGYHVNAILRNSYDLKKVVKDNPFDTIKSELKNKLYVTFLSDIPAFDVRGSLGVYSNDAEYARVVGREAHIVSPNYGKTCFSNSFIEKKLGLPATTRNWVTVNKMLEL
jgi:uncharacterized protein (DUF1697 family)